MIIKIWIIQAKLDPQTVSELFSLVESRTNDSEGFRLELCTDPSDADIIVTAVRMKKRLERHIDWNVARQKFIVTPDWLRNSVKEGRSVSCGDYAALKELQDETAHRCQDLSSVDPTPEKSARLFEPTSEKVKANYASRYACCRASPLVSPNQALLEELTVLERHRELEGKSVNALSYARAISMLKAYPHPITSEIFQKEVQSLPHLGDKIKYKIKEFIKNGFIEERAIRASMKYQALSAFVSVHGVGPSTAQKLYELGVRTIEDMERYYDIHRDDATNLASINEPIYTPNGKFVSPHKTRMPDISIKVGLLLREEFATPIPSDEVEEIHRVVMKELDQIQPGCVGTIVGGYRRGKVLSNDVDIIFSHPDQQRGGEIIKGVCQKLTFRLYKRGLIIRIDHTCNEFGVILDPDNTWTTYNGLGLSGFHPHDAQREGHWNSLEKALTVFILPDDGQQKRIHRRLDMIFASPDTYWTAVIGWSGSKMFERDLRLWAKVEKGMKFDSTGLTRRHDSKLLIPKNEKDVFDILGLEWVDPTMRNADV